MLPACGLPGLSPGRAGIQHERQSSPKTVGRFTEDFRPLCGTSVEMEGRVAAPQLGGTDRRRAIITAPTRSKVPHPALELSREPLLQAQPPPPVARTPPPVEPPPPVSLVPP